MNNKMMDALKALEERGCKVEVKTHCIFCDKEEMVSIVEATDYICDDCKEFFKSEMSEPPHETAKMFRRGKDGEQEAERDYEQSVEYAQYCERYEPTYNPEDGSL